MKNGIYLYSNGLLYTYPNYERNLEILIEPQPITLSIQFPKTLFPSLYTFDLKVVRILKFASK